MNLFKKLPGPFLVFLGAFSLSFGGLIVGDNNNPTTIAIIPATSCKGIMSTWGNFRIINIKIANEIGIINATMLPVICPGVIELPNITKIPEIARTIQKMVDLEIVSFKKK